MDAIHKQVRRAQRRLTIDRFVGALGWCVTGCLAVALGVIVARRFYPLGLIDWAWAAGGVGLGVVLAIVWAVVGRRGPVETAVVLDRRFGLKERVSSSLAMSEEEIASEAGQALVADATKRVEGLDVGDRFAVSGRRQLLYPLVPGALALIVTLWISPAAVTTEPPVDPVAVRKKVKKATETLRKELAQREELARKQGLKEAEELFKRLRQGTEGASTDANQDPKEKMVEMNDLSRELAERRKQLGGAQQVRSQLNQLKDMGKGPAEKMLDKLSKGDFKAAQDELRKMQKDLASGNMTPEQQKQLANQMQNMANKLNEMVQAQKQAQKDLQDQVDKARQAGDDQKADQLQQKLDQAKQQAQQMNQLDKLAQKLGKCGQCMKQGKMGDAQQAMKDMAGQLDDLQQQLKEMEMVDGMMQQLTDARDQMNCKQCAGGGCKACQGQGDGMGKGRGRGLRPEEANDVSFYDANSQVKLHPGTAVVVGETDGANIKGEVREQIRVEFETARGSKTDPLAEQRIPKRHQDHTRDYFNRLRQGN